MTTAASQDILLSSPTWITSYGDAVTLGTFFGLTDNRTYTVLFMSSTSGFLILSALLS